VIDGKALPAGKYGFSLPLAKKKASSFFLKTTLPPLRCNEKTGSFLLG